MSLKHKQNRFNYIQGATYSLQWSSKHIYIGNKSALQTLTHFVGNKTSSNLIVSNIISEEDNQHVYFKKKILM